MSLNMVFWTIVITVFYVGIFIGCAKDMKIRGFKAEDKKTLIGLTFFYIAVLVGIWVVYPEGWF